MNVSSNLLSAVSLALAALAMFYSLWWPDIELAKNVKIPEHVADRGPLTRQLESVLKLKALPIAVASVTVAALAAPPAISVFDQFFRSLVKSGWKTFDSYNAIESIFVAVWVGMLLIAYSTSSALRSVKGKLRDLKGK